MAKVPAGTGATSVRLQATLSPGQTLAFQAVNSDGSFSAFSLTGTEVFQLFYVAVSPFSTSAPVTDVSLVQPVPAAGTATRWTFRGALDRNALHYFGEPGMFFSTNWQAASSAASQEMVVVDLWGIVGQPADFPVVSLQLVASVGPGQSAVPQQMNPDGTLTDFTSPADGIGVAVISVARQTAAAAEALLDVSLVQQVNAALGGQAVTRWGFRGPAVHNVELSFSTGAQGFDVSGVTPANPLTIASGAQSEDGVVVNLICWPAVSGLIELIANVGPGGSVVPSLQNADGTQLGFPSIPPGQVFRLLSISVERLMLSATAQPLAISLTQATVGIQNRWTLLGTIARNFKTDLGFDTGMAFSTPLAVESASDSGDGALVHLWGFMGTTTVGTRQAVELLANVPSGQTITPQFRNPDGTLSPFSLAPNQGFQLNYLSIRRLKFDDTPALVDLSLTQNPVGGGLMPRWAFLGSAAYNIERPFYPGIVFTTPFNLQSGAQSSDGLVVTIHGFLYEIGSIASYTEFFANLLDGEIADLAVVNPDGSVGPIPTSVDVLRIGDISIQNMSLTDPSATVSVRLFPAAPGIWWAAMGQVSGNLEQSLVGGAFCFAQSSSASPITVENDAVPVAGGVTLRLWSEGV